MTSVHILTHFFLFNQLSQGKIFWPLDKLKRKYNVACFKAVFIKMNVAYRFIFAVHQPENLPISFGASLFRPLRCVKGLSFQRIFSLLVSPFLKQVFECQLWPLSWKTVTTFMVLVKEVPTQSWTSLSCLPWKCLFLLCILFLEDPLGAGVRVGCRLRMLPHQKLLTRHCLFTYTLMVCGYSHVQLISSARLYLALAT